MKFKFLYNNMASEEREFPSWKDAEWFAHTQGDHLYDWYEMKGSEQLNDYLDRAPDGSVIMASTPVFQVQLKSAARYRGFKINEHDEWSWGWMIRRPDGSFVSDKD